MEHTSNLQILEIFRSRKINSTFFILTKKELYKVNQEMYSKILQGFVYKNDTIKITKEDREAGIIFEVVDEEVDDNDFQYNYYDYIYDKYTLLPFLSDTLPYQIKEVDYLPVDVKSNMTGRIVFKTRINYAVNSEYLFFILEVGTELVKAIIWKEKLKYSSLNVGDIIGITKLRQGKGYPPQGHIENNEFSELSFFKLREITVIELFKIPNEDKPQKSIDNKLFSDVSGFIKYRSVLNRRNHHRYMEYYLLEVGNKKVMLFYNSDLEFYKIEAGNKIEITNLRSIIRKGETFYISTVFTQIKYEDIAEHNEMCTTFLHEAPGKRKIVDIFETEERTPDSKKRRRIEDPNVGDLSIKDNKPKSSPSKLEISNGDIMHILDDNTVTVNLEVVTEINPRSNLSSNYEEETSFVNGDYIDSAYGFLPDSIFQEDDEHVKINDETYTLTPFFVPKKIKIEDLETNSQKLVINESDKFLIEGKILEVKANTEYCISYIDTDVIKKQYPLTVHIENCIPVYVFANFFARDRNELNRKIYDFIGSECYIVLHVFRASIDHVIYSISDIEKK